jgi:hypothetical protein
MIRHAVWSPVCARDCGAGALARVTTQGSGASVIYGADNIGRLAPAGLLAIHLNLLVPALAGAGNLPKNTDGTTSSAVGINIGTRGKGGAAGAPAARHF